MTHSKIWIYTYIFMFHLKNDLMMIKRYFTQFSPFSHSVRSNSLWPHGLKQARLPCPSPTPRVYSNSSPLSWWCHPTLSSSLVPFSSCPQSVPAPGSFLMSPFFASGGQSIGVSPSTSVLRWISKTDFLQDGLVGSPCCSRDSHESSPTPQFKSINSLVLSLLYSPTLHIHTWLLEKL